MPDKNDAVVIKIKKHPEKPGKCSIDPDPFEATRESVVTFRVAGPRTQITFLPGPPPLSQTEISPFDKNEFEVDKEADMVVRKDAREGHYEYSVTWRETGGDIVGNGTGEVVSR